MAEVFHISDLILVDCILNSGVAEEALTWNSIPEEIRNDIMELQHTLPEHFQPVIDKINGITEKVRKIHDEKKVRYNFEEHKATGEKGSSNEEEGRRL